MCLQKISSRHPASFNFPCFNTFCGPSVMAEDRSSPLSPSLAWHIGSTATMGLVGGITRLFMTIPNSTKSHGKDAFMDLIDDREDVEGRRRGLITGRQPLSPIARISMLIQAPRSFKSYQRVRMYHTSWRHIGARPPADRAQWSSRIDDPLIWGVLPYRYHLYPNNHRWSLGSYYIVFKNK